MANPKIRQLISKAIELGAADEEGAREIIKSNKVLTFGKLEKVMQKKSAKSSRERGSGLAVDQLSAESALEHSPIQVDKKVVRRPGPRGFRFGPAFMKSVMEGKGPAVRPANLPKLLSLASAKGVKLPRRESLTQKEVVEIVRTAL